MGCVPAQLEATQGMCACAASSASSDPSQEQCKALLQPVLAQLPPADQLSSIITQPWSARIEIFPQAYQLLKDSDPELADCFVACASVSHSLCRKLSHIISENHQLGSEAMTSTAVYNVFVQTLLIIDELLPHLSPMRIGLQVQRDQADCDSLMTLLSAAGKSLRPDLVLRAKDQLRMLFKGEEKGLGHSLAEAVEVRAAVAQDFSDAVFLTPAPLDFATYHTNFQPCYKAELR